MAEPAAGFLATRAVTDHFLLKAEARTLPVVKVLAMSDDDALALFRHLRWGEGEEAVCRRCAAFRAGLVT